MTYVLILSRYYRIGAPIDSSERVERELKIIEQIPYADLFREGMTIAGIKCKMGQHMNSFNGETWIHALLNRRFAEDEVGNRLYEALEEVKKWSFHQNWVANSLNPHPDVVKVSQDFEELLSFKQHKISSRYESKDGKKFIVRGGMNRFQIINNDNKHNKLENQILELRRQVLHLNQELEKKNRENQNFKESN